MPRSEDIWGDDASERDADATLAELQANPSQPSRGPDMLFPLKVVWRFIKRNGRRAGVAIAGFTLIIIGAALLALPGPGWLLIFAGLAILATEYVWAQRLLNAAKRKAEQAKNKVIGNKNRKPANEGDIQ